MRNPRADALQKNAIMKKVRDKCKMSCCIRCEYKNGNLFCIVLILLLFYTLAIVWVLTQNISQLIQFPFRYSKRAGKG